MKKDVNEDKIFSETLIFQIESGIMKLPEEVWKAVLAPYAEKYGWRII